MYYRHMHKEEKVSARPETLYLCHPVIHLHCFDPLAQALCCRGGLCHYTGVKVWISHVLTTDFLHHRDLQ